MKNNDTLNYLFVKVFNKILSVEEQTLKKCCSNLSVTEIHVIAACADLEKEHANTMSRVAKELSLTTGALSVSVNAIVKKGYLERRYSEKGTRGAP